MESVELRRASCQAQSGGTRHMDTHDLASSEPQAAEVDREDSFFKKHPLPKEENPYTGWGNLQCPDGPLDQRGESKLTYTSECHMFIPSLHPEQVKDATTIHPPEVSGHGLKLPRDFLTAWSVPKGQFSLRQLLAIYSLSC